MLKKRGLAVFASAFAVVLIGGVAMAAVGVFAPAGETPSGDGSQLVAGDRAFASSVYGELGGDGIGDVPGDRPGDDRPDDTPTDEPGDDDPGDDGAAGPRIEILRPEHGAHVDSKVIVVAGRVELPAQVTIGDRKAAVDDEGHWMVRVELVEGRNRIVAVATDRSGNSSRDHIVVFYDESRGFTAHQRLDVVEGENPVSNYYWGTGRPGAPVDIGSEYGRGETTVDDFGMWELRVQFEAPCNQVFRVAAESGDARVGFEMKRACREEHVFTAHQKYEVVDGENPVSNYYWGTGRPGAEVHVGSEFGRGATKVNEAGRWELRVQFEAPCNQVFRVAAESGDARVGFEMKRACREEHVFTAHQKYEVVDGDNPVSNYYWGTGRPGAEVHVGSEFGRGATKVNEAGRWELRVQFEAPCNQVFRVAAESGDARVGFEMKRACREEHVFTAHQKYGSCGEPIPYDVFYGTGTPGATVFVESRFGSGKSTVDDRGKWEIRVEFPEAPRDEEFEVVIESSEGGRAVFTFVATGEDDHG